MDDTTERALNDEQAVEAIRGMLAMDTEVAPAAEAEEVEEAEAIEEPEGEPEQENAGSDETEAEAAEPDESLIPVKVNGKVEFRTLDELKQGFAGQAYIQQRMQEVAAERRAAQEAKAQAERMQSEILQMYQQFQTGEVPLRPPVEPDYTLSTKDPIAYLQEDARYKRELQAYNAAQQRVMEMQRQRAEVSQRQTAEMVREQQEILARMVPEYGDPEKRKELIARTSEIATRDYGFDRSEIDSITDARMARVLFDAAAYRKMQSQSGQIQQKTEKARPVIKPGAQARPNPRSKADEMLSRARKTQSDNDWISVIRSAI